MPYLTVSGYLTEPKAGQSNNGKNFYTITVAEKQRGNQNGQQPPPMYYDATWWGEAAQKMTGKLQKGQFVTVSGKAKFVTFNRNNGSTGSKVEFDPGFDVTFGPRPQNSGNNQNYQNQNNQGYQNQGNQGYQNQQQGGNQGYPQQQGGQQGYQNQNQPPPQPQQGGYPPQQQGYPPQQGGQQQQGYPPQQGNPPNPYRN